MDPVVKAAHQVSLDKRLDVELAHWSTQNSQFNNNWARAFGFIYEHYCSREIKCSIRELPNLETVIQENQLDSFMLIERLMQVPTRALYPTLVLIETLTPMMAVQ